MDGLFETGMSHKGATYTNTAPLSADTKFEVSADFAVVHFIGSSALCHPSCLPII